MLPKAHAALVLQAHQFNAILWEAVASNTKLLHWVFFMDMYQHFTDEEGNILQPSNKYFSDNKLTYRGAFVFRACLFHEMGLMGYWFDDESGLHYN